MNNRGQVLVVFVIFLPIFLFILAMVVDYGLLMIEKRKIDNNIYDAVEYYLENIDEENIYNDVMNLLNSNLKDVNISINENDEYIEIIVDSSYKSLYNSITNGGIRISYKGYKETKKIIKG